MHVFLFYGWPSSLHGIPPKFCPSCFCLRIQTIIPHEFSIGQAFATFYTLPIGQNFGIIHILTTYTSTSSRLSQLSGRPWLLLPNFSQYLKNVLSRQPSCRPTGRSTRSKTRTIINSLSKLFYLVSQQEAKLGQLSDFIKTVQMCSNALVFKYALVCKYACRS